MLLLWSCGWNYCKYTPQMAVGWPILSAHSSQKFIETVPRWCLCVQSVYLFGSDMPSSRLVPLWLGSLTLSKIWPQTGFLSPRSPCPETNQTRSHAAQTAWPAMRKHLLSPKSPPSLYWEVSQLWSPWVSKVPVAPSLGLLIRHVRQVVTYSPTTFHTPGH